MMTDRDWQVFSSLTHTARLLAHTTEVLDTMLYRDFGEETEGHEKLKQLLPHLYGGIAVMNGMMHLFERHSETLRQHRSNGPAVHLEDGALSCETSCK
jgi:hypothetical protein